MLRPPKNPEPKIQAHIFMTAAIKAQIERNAQKACRSVNGQIVFYIQQGVEQDRAAGK